MPPAEPRLQAVARTLIPAGISGTELSRLEHCWLPLLNPFPWGENEAAAIGRRGALLFGFGARLLGHAAVEGEPFGAAWSLAEAACRIPDPQSRAIVLERAKSAIAKLPTSRELRPLTMITVRSAYDLLYGNRRGWHRSLMALRYLLFGRVPR